ncbi:hypothetical protein [Methylophaga sp. OBS4]|uniref:hypothetical protein n=1 Tax=Methylophaga sp. OBS4 TaxID=2991935 RepID=UPI00225355AE|nr:hypothetical protein [Methylophaga sp. OBS4]MCX4188268.1 hypothetical protein [Methylophaga sp. OBS4]
MNKYLVSAILLAASTQVFAESDLVTPADMSAEAQNQMYNLITEYNGCMMQSRLQTSQDGKQAQQAAQNILQSCESHLDDLKVHLTDNQVETSLVEGMAKTLRSRAARQLMTRTMNNLAAQAAAMQNAEQLKRDGEAAE